MLGVRAAGQAIAYNDQGGASRLEEAVDTIFEAEKKSRLAGELGPTRKACMAIIELCFELGDWTGTQTCASNHIETCKGL